MFRNSVQTLKVFANPLLFTEWTSYAQSILCLLPSFCRRNLWIHVVLLERNTIGRKTVFDPVTNCPVYSQGAVLFVPLVSVLRFVHFVHKCGSKCCINDGTVLHFGKDFLLNTFIERVYGAERLELPDGGDDD